MKSDPQTIGQDCRKYDDRKKGARSVVFFERDVEGKAARIAATTVFELRGRRGSVREEGSKGRWAHGEPVFCGAEGSLEN